MAALPTNPISVLIKAATATAILLKTNAKVAEQIKMCLLIVNKRLQALIAPPAQEHLPDAGVPARGEVAVRLSWEARVFVHHCFEQVQQEPV